MNKAPDRPRQGPHRVLIADDHELFRSGVAGIISDADGFEVVGEAADGQEAVDLYRTLQPDVALLDLRMPRLSGVEAVRAIRDADPSARLIILTTFDTSEEISLALKAGARAYLLKDVSAGQLLACLREVLAGRAFIAPAIAAKLADQITRVQLTPRELQVLQQLAKGVSNKAIGATLGISEATVKVHSTRVFEKLGVSTRTEALASAVRRGLVRLDGDDDT